MWVQRPRLLAALAGGRALFFPLFVLCVRPAVVPWPGQLLLVLLFSLSNGWLGSLAFMTAIERLPPDSRQAGATLSAAALVAGLSVGATVGYVFSLFYFAAPEASSSLSYAFSSLSDDFAGSASSLLNASAACE